MDSGAAEGAIKDISAQRETVKGITSEVKKLIGIQASKTFRTDDPDSGAETKIDFFNVSVDPIRWRRWPTRNPNRPRHYRDQSHFGRQVSISIDERQSVLDGGQPDTLIKPRRFRLDTNLLLQSPKLLISTEDQTPYLASQRERHIAKLAEYFDLPREEQWREPTEAEAQALLAQIKKLDETKQLEHMYGDRTKGQENEHAAFRKKLEEEIERIFTVANDDVIENEHSHSLTLALGEKTVSVSRSKGSNALHLEIAETDEDSGGTQTVQESYTSAFDMPITHRTHFKRDNKKDGTQTPAKDLDQDQANYLFSTLETLTDDKIQEQLTARKEFVSHIEELLKHDATTTADSVSRAFEQASYYASVRKITSGSSEPSYVVTIENFVDEDHPELEDAVKSQTFSLHFGHPLEVKTEHYGDNFLELKSKNATHDQTSYINTLLDEFVKNPPPPAPPDEDE